MDTVKSLGMILSILLSITAGLLTMAGGGDGLWKHTGIVTVSAPPDVVFEWLTNPERRKTWIEGMTESRSSSPGRLEKGSRLEETLRLDGKLQVRTVEITEFEEGTVFAYTTTVEGAVVELRYLVGNNMSGRKSRIDYTCSVQFPGVLARVIEPILGHGELGRMEADFARLQQGCSATN